MDTKELQQNLEQAIDECGLNVVLKYITMICEIKSAKETKNVELRSDWHRAGAYVTTAAAKFQSLSIGKM